MSGSGGNGDGGAGGGGGEGLDCSTLRYRTTLTSPVPAVIAKLKSKDVLELDQPKPDGPLYAMFGGKIAGSIAGAFLVRLLKCIDDGYDFEAIVIKVAGGNVEVEIRPEGA